MINQPTLDEEKAKKNNSVVSKTNFQNSPRVISLVPKKVETSIQKNILH